MIKEEYIKGKVDEFSKFVEDVFGDGGYMSKTKPGYSVREEQMKAMIDIYRSMEAQGNYILEGPCGFGKSFAYLVPAIYYNMKNKPYSEEETMARTIIVTDGITLLEQLYTSDIPAISDMYKNTEGHVVNASIMKGRQNFLCKDKISELLFNQRNNVAGLSPEVNEEISKILKWSESTKTGDKSELDYEPSYEVWREVSCMSSDECKGCEDNGCFYKKLKKKCSESDIVITNYHTLLADVQTGFMVLPGKEILIFDEAHAFASIARDFLEVKVTSYTVGAISKKFSEACNKSKSIQKEDASFDELISVSDRFFEQATNIINPQRKRSTIMLNHEIPLFKHFVYELNKVYSSIESVIENKAFGEDEYLLSSVQSKITDAVNTLNMIQHKSNPRFAYYSDLEKNELVSLRAKPIKVDEELNANFFGKISLSTVTTSATLSVNGNLDYIKTELGIKESDGVIASSPFDLTNQQLWYLPKDSKEANSPDFIYSMTDSFIDLCKVSNGGVLALFTSIYNMNHAAKEIRRTDIDKSKVLVQGDMPRSALLKKFREDRDSILIGTKSMFTGVDVPGDSLRAVFIDKLPFVTPDDPVMRSLKKDPQFFFKYYIPDMCITFKQAVGRGVRNKNDKCVIVVADKRLSTARYKGKINASFNYPKTGTRELSDVKEFIGSFYTGESIFKNYGGLALDRFLEQDEDTPF